MRAIQNGGWTSGDEVIHQAIKELAIKIKPIWERQGHWKHWQSRCLEVVEEVAEKLGDYKLRPLVRATLNDGDIVTSNGLPTLVRASLRKCSQCGEENVRTDLHWMHDCLDHWGAHKGYCQCERAYVIYPRMVPMERSRRKEYQAGWPSHFSRCEICTAEAIKREKIRTACKVCGQPCEGWSDRRLCSDECKKRFNIEKKNKLRGNVLLQLQGTLTSRMESSNVKVAANRKIVPHRYV